MTEPAGGENELLVTAETLLGTPVIAGVEASTTGTDGGTAGVTAFDGVDSELGPTASVA